MALSFLKVASDELSFSVGGALIGLLTAEEIEEIPFFLNETLPIVNFINAIQVITSGT
jgi:hypothetical protein